MSALSELPQLPAPRPVDLKEHWKIVMKRRASFIQAFVIVMIIGIAATVLSKPIYQTRAKLLVPAAASSVSLIDSNNPIATMLAAAQPDGVATQIQVLLSEPFLREARQAAGVKPRPDVIAPAVEVEAEAGTNIIRIAVQGGDPTEIARLANTILDLHLEQTDLNVRTGLGDTIEFVKKERNQATRRLQSVTLQLLNFQRTHRIAQLTAEQEASTRELAEVKIAVREAERNVASTQAEITDLQAQLRAEPPVLTEEIPRPNPAYVKLEERLNDLQAKKAELLLDFLPGSESVTILDERITNLQAQLNAHPKTIGEMHTTSNPARTPLRTRVSELKAVLRGHQTDYRAALAGWNDRKGLVKELGPLELQQQTLIQERESAQSAYTQLSDRLRDLEIRKNARLRTARAIERAGVPTVPIQPRPVQNILLTVLLALCVALGVAYLQEYLDDRVDSPDDLERYYSLSTLGYVPTIETGESNAITHLQSNSHIAEAYRVLRSSIGFAALDGPLRRLQVTSASKGEGKTITSINLATVMALDGKRVIIVDADLRRPNVHRQLGLQNAPGLSDLIAGTATIDEAIQSTSVENLSAICSGPIPPNPAELLGSPAFERLLVQLDERADVILFDTPPCMPVTDPLVIAGRMDGIILVLLTGQTRKGALKHVLEQLHRTRVRILGVVFNQVDAKQGSYYYYYNYYRYREGYYRDEANNGNGKRQRRRKNLPPQLGASSHPSQISHGDDENA